MELTNREEGKVLIVGLSGRLTADCSESFKKHLNDAIVGHGNIILDLGKMEYVDSTGLGAMVYVLQKITDEGGRLMLAALQAKPRVVFNITKAYKIFDIYDTTEAALGAMNA